MNRQAGSRHQVKRAALPCRTGHGVEERFGRLPQRVRRKVVALASSEELQGLLSRALTARSLDELGFQ